MSRLLRALGATVVALALVVGTSSTTSALAPTLPSVVDIPFGDATAAGEVAGLVLAADAPLDLALHRQVDRALQIELGAMRRLVLAEQDRAAARMAQAAPVDAPTTQPVEAAAAGPTPAVVPALSAAVAPDDGRPHHEVVGQQALERLRHIDLAAIGWRAEFHPGRPGYLGMADQHRKVVDIWVRDHHTVDEVLATLAHEAVHALDYSVWTDDVRNEWMRMRGIGDWWPTCSCEDRGFGAGDIAEAAAMLEAGRSQWRGQFGVPTQAQLAWLRDHLA